MNGVVGHTWKNTCMPQQCLCVCVCVCVRAIRTRMHVYVYVSVSLLHNTLDTMNETTTVLQTHNSYRSQLANITLYVRTCCSCVQYR